MEMRYEKNYHCLAKARFHGIHNVQIQAYMAAIAINIKRLGFLFFINVLILLKCKLPFATGRSVFRDKQNQLYILLEELVV